MQRVPEPELMSDAEQAHAYAEADFSEPHNHFIEVLTEKLHLVSCEERVLDLGCGPCDISIRFARRFSGCVIDAVDGSPAMLMEAEKAIARLGLENRIHLSETLLPDPSLTEKYELIISNSLLHHLHDPDVLWSTIKQTSDPGSEFFIMDLCRPDSDSAAKELVEAYAANEPEILRHDFYHSLKAAFTLDEIQNQLCENDMVHAEVEVISDRHFCIYGRVYPD